MVTVQTQQLDYHRGSYSKTIYLLNFRGQSIKPKRQNERLTFSVAKAVIFSEREDVVLKHGKL